MDRERVYEVIEYFKLCLIKNGIEPVEIILFGSHTRANAEAESDIDIAVVSEKFKGLDIFQRAELLSKSEIETIKRFLVPIDVIPLTKEELDEESSLMSEVVKCGEIV